MPVRAFEERNYFVVSRVTCFNRSLWKTVTLMTESQTLFTLKLRAEKRRRKLQVSSTELKNDRIN